MRNILGVLLCLFAIANVSFAAEKEGRMKPDKKAALLNFLAGGLAGTVSSSLTAPLEVIKTQLQSSRVSGKLNPIQVCQEIIKLDGPAGLFKGLQPLLVGIIPTRAIYFWAYAGTKNALNSTIGNGPLNHLASAFSAGITSNTITSPLWMVKTRFQIVADTTVGQRKYKNYQEVIKAIYKEEGPPGFFKGLTASYVGCIEGAIQWIVYEKAKKFLSMPRPVVSATGEYSAPEKERTPTPTEYFLAAAASKFIAVCLTYPHEVVRTRMREQATNGAFRYNGFINTLKVIAKEEGRRCVYDHQFLPVNTHYQSCRRCLYDFLF
jgi:solute carrier family 25, member 33/36